MNNSNNVPPNQEQAVEDPQVTPSNIERDGTVLEETIEELSPNATDDEAIIKSEIDQQAYEDRIAELEGEVKAAKEGQARANAEAYNMQKRAQQEADKSKKFALQKFAKELLEVVDNLERAIISVENDDDADDAIMDGVKLTHKSLLSALNKHGVEVINPEDNAPFDPEQHEAVGIDPDAAADTVGAVLQKGYSLNGRLLRPAMVKVGQ